jgi:hypothetical protein
LFSFVLSLLIVAGSFFHPVIKNDSGGRWRVGKSLEAFASKVASQWQTAFFYISPKSA